MKANYLMAILLVASLGVSAGEVLVKTDEKVAFLGDSITQFGADSETGYVNLVASGLAANDIKIKVIRAGISGHKSNQMLERLEKSVLKHKPQWMLLSCGVNDVMHGSRGIELEPYKKNITEIVDQTLAKGIKVMILTATMISENPEDKRNKKLAGYNTFLRQLAKEKNCPLADLNADMQRDVKKLKDAGYKGNALTYDGVHMAPRGDLMMATGILRAFGLNEEQMKKAEAAWMKEPVCFSFNPRRTSKKNAERRKYPHVSIPLEEVLKKDLEINKESGKNFKSWLNNNAQKALDKQFKK